MEQEDYAMKNRSGFVAVFLVVMVVTSAAITSAQRKTRYKGSSHCGMGREMGQMTGIPGLSENPLSQSQKKQIAQIRQETCAHVQRVRNDSRFSASQKEQKILNIRKDGHRRIMSILTDAQRREFNNWWNSRPDYGMGMGRNGMHGMSGGMKPGMMQGRGHMRGDSPSSSAGKSIFQDNCVVCHGEDGMKIAGWKSKVRGMSEAQVQQTIRNGRKGMPAFDNTLSADQIQAVAGYAKELASGG